MSDVEMNEEDSGSDSEESMDEDQETNQEGEGKETIENDSRPNVYLPGVPLQEGEELVCDQSAYVMLHQAQSGAPCLSFDIVLDNLGDDRETFPLTAYIVAGTQAARTHTNNVVVMKMQNLNKTGGEDEDDDEESDDDENDKPQMSFASMKHLGCINRIRAARYNDTTLAASWSELGRVNIWNLTQQLQLLDNPTELANYNKNNVGNTVMPVFTFSGHQQEGFAVDWSQMMPGTLATGDCKRDIHIWKPQEGGSWQVDQRPLVGHTNSVEDLQWSPNERSVLASCSIDKSIRIWDTRAAPNKACMLTTENSHDSDVNVISWNRNEPFIVSGKY